jgi:hypothetical protein
MATKLNTHQAFQKLCALNKSWGLLISENWNGSNIEHDIVESIKAVPYLHIEKDMQIIVDGFGILLFSTEEECRKYYNQTVGDDGPTKTNPYNGPGNWYDLTCDPNGNLVNENT